MTWNPRLSIAEALEHAGWAGDEGNPLGILRHTSSGAVWALTNESGDCGIDTPGGGGIDLPADVPDTVVIAAALAASGQLAPAVTVVCDVEGHALPHTAGCPKAPAAPDDEYRYCGASLGRDEYPFTCERRIAHDGLCSPEADCRHISWEVTSEYPAGGRWVKSRKCADCGDPLPPLTEDTPHWNAPTRRTPAGVEAAELQEAADHARFSPAHVRLAADGLHTLLAGLLDARAVRVRAEPGAAPDEVTRLLEDIARQLLGDRK